MSSGSGRYRSRLFNFFHRQSRQVVEKCEQAFRHLKVTTKWSVEALLYPVYALFQSMDVGKQISGGVRQSTLFPASDEDYQSPPNVDTPIQRILEAVTTPTKKPGSFFHNQNQIATKNCELRIANCELPLPSIRAIATQLATRTVVLVTAENEIQDVLTPDQQQQIEEQILLEVARYWHFWRLYTNKNSLSAEEQTASAFPAADQTIPAFPAADRAIVLLDKIIAEIETAVPPVGMTATLQERSWEIIKVVKTQLNLFLYGVPPVTTVAADDLPPASSTNIAADETMSQLKIPALIWAAIGYFFGNRDRQISPTTPKLSEINKSSQFPNLITDPWLGNDDLFGEPKVEAPTADQQLIELPAGQAKYSLPNLIQWLTNKIALRSAPSGGSASLSPSELALRQKSTHFLARIRRTTATLVSFITEESSISLVDATQTGEISAPKTQPTGIAHTPDWIETTAQTIGYKRHPLEQILAWLDRLMLWLEEMFVKIWQSIQHFVRGK